MRTATLLRLPALAGAALLAAGVASAQETDLQAQIEEAQQRYEAAWTGGDIDALVEMHSEDALMWPLSGGSFEGHEALRGYFEDAPQPVTFEITSERTERLGDVVLDIGTFSGTWPEEAGGEAFEGEYVVLARPGDGGLTLHRVFAFPPRQEPPANR